MYKCIVAVTSPHAFDANKWDDVTTSEVFAKKSRIIATFNGAADKTYRQLLNEGFSTINSSAPNIKLIFISPAYEQYFDCRQSLSQEYRFTFDRTDANRLITATLNITETTSTYGECKVETGNVTFTSHTTDFTENIALSIIAMD